MQGGWGAMGAGAWGASPAAQQDEPDSPTAPPPPAAAASSAFGTNNSFKPNPLTSAGPSAASHASNNAFGGSSASITDREKALKQKEKELAAREKAVAEKERELAASGVSLKKKNWPICMPFWYHNISEDIPEKSRRVVREAYMCWWGLLLVLSYQFFCATVALGLHKGNSVPSWFLSIIFWMGGVPLSIWLWYKRIYEAARSDSTLGYVAFFIFFFCNFAWCAWCAIGLQINAAQWCFAGFIAGFSALGDNTFLGVIYVVGGALWSILAAYSLWVMKDAWWFFRGQGGVQEVRQRAAQEAALAAFKDAQGGNRV